MAKVTVRRTRKIRAEPSLAIKTAAGLIVRHHRERLRRGLDRDGAPMFGRSRLYALQLAAIGKGGNAVGTLSGTTAASIELRRVKKPLSLDPVMVFGADSKTETHIERPPWWIWHPSKTPQQRATALARWQAGARGEQKSTRAWTRDKRRLVWSQDHGFVGKAKWGYKAGGAPTHYRIMKWLVGGYHGRRLRRTMGVTSAARAEILRAIERARIFQT